MGFNGGFGGDMGIMQRDVGIRGSRGLVSVF